MDFLARPVLCEIDFIYRLCGGVVDSSNLSCLGNVHSLLIDEFDEVLAFRVLHWFVFFVTSLFYHVSSVFC